MVVVHQGGRPQFVRTIGSGGNATTAAISAALDIPIVDAETLKYRFGEDSAQIQAAERVAQPSMLELVEEIRNSIQYFASLPDRLPVSRVVVTGGGSGLQGLSAMLEAKVRIPVTFGSPFERLDTSKLDLAPDQAAMVIPVLASPIGLALPEPDTAVKKFNLLPPEVAQKARLQRIQDRTLVGSVAVLVLLVVFGGWKFLQVHNAENNVNALQSNIASLNAQVPKYGLVVAANDAYTKGLARRASVLNSAVDWPLALSSLIAITPPKASVLTFSGTRCRRPGRPPPAPPAPRRPPSARSPAPPPGPSRRPSARSTSTSTGPGPSLSISEAWINAISTSQFFANPLQGATTVESRLHHLLPLHHLGHPDCQPQQECEPEMNSLREYRTPLLIAGGAFIVAIILWVALISPQNSKLSSLQTQSVALQAQEASLQARLTALQSEGQKLSSNCADLAKISTQIPSVQSPTDVDAEESSFESQFNALAAIVGSHPRPVQRIHSGHDHGHGAPTASTPRPPSPRPPEPRARRPA